MEKDGRYDVGQIEGNENMSAAEKEYFSKSWTTMGDQEEIIADEHGIDSETMRDEFADIMNSLVNDIGEYIVNGATLKCSMQMDADNVQKLSYKGTDVISRPNITEEMSMLQLPENRQEGARGRIFANVEDTIGGMRDEIGKEGSQLNIVGFGNCRRLEKENIRSIAEFMLNDWLLADNKAWRTFSKDQIAEKVKEAIEQGRGTCYCGMLLNPKWENLPTKFDFATDTFQSEATGDTYFCFNGKEGINRMSMLFCKRGGIIAPINSGQLVGMEEILDDIRRGLYTLDDFYYLVAVASGEADTYEGMVAIIYEVLNRCRADNKSIADVVAGGAYEGYKDVNYGIVPADGMAKEAVLAVLRGEADNPIGDIKYHFGRQTGYDLWCEADKCTSVIVIGEGPYRNVFYEPDGAVHNKQTQKTEDAIVIYDSKNNKWLYDGEVIGNANAQ